MKRIFQAAVSAVFLCLNTCAAAPVFASEALPIEFSSFMQTIATALFAACVVGVWKMHAQLTDMNGRLTNAVAFIESRQNEFGNRLLFLERIQQKEIKQ